MPGAGALDLAPRDFQRGFLCAHRIALVRGSGSPVFHRVRLRRVEFDARLQWLEPLWKLPHDLLQSTLLDFQITLSRDFLRCPEVETRLSFVSIGDRCGADLEIALGLGELLGDRHLLPLDERKTVLRGENVEIGLRDAHYQILRRLAESSFGLRCFESGFLIHLDILPIVFFLMIRRPPRSTLFPYTTAFP